MFCYQCEQKAKDEACTVQGVCGKSPDVAALQDLIIHAVEGISMYAHRAHGLGAKDEGIDRFILQALFRTVTNVNFDPASLAETLKKAGTVKDKAKALYEEAAKGAGKEPELLSGPAAFIPEVTVEGLIGQGAEVSIKKRIDSQGEDITGLQELLTYGLKGLAAYAEHAAILGKEDPAVYGFFHEALDFLTQKEVTVDQLVGINLRCGETNIRVLELLDTANTETYGTPEPTQARIDPVKGKCLLVSGHDLKDLDEILKQTEGKGINVYTHGEMLPCLAYPALKKYSHLVGNYGGAWQDQQKEFDAFPGAIVMTTNCIQKPRDSYLGRIFTTHEVAWPGSVHIDGYDFAPAIEAALAAPGFTEDGPGKTITIGFGHGTVMSVAGKVIDAVKGGAIKHFFLIGGCDGAKPGRNYFTDFAEKVPDDCVILTLACGKYRFNKLDFGDIGGIPRLLDMGQCNDAYSAVKVAMALADAFDTDVNGLPLSMIISWYEQKAVVILLSLLHLGIKKIRLGPSLPAFVTPAVLKVLVDNYEIAPISTAEEDLKAILG